MIKAVKTGFITGLSLAVAIALLLLAISALELTSITALILLLAFMILALWIAMKQYDEQGLLKWKYLLLTGTVASITTAVFAGAGSFIFTRYIQPSFLSEVLVRSRQFLAMRNSSLISGENIWAWFRNPFSFAFNNFQATGIVLVFLSLVVASIYYFRNRDKYSFQNRYKNPELIF